MPIMADSVDAEKCNGGGSGQMKNEAEKREKQIKSGSFSDGQRWK